MRKICNRKETAQGIPISPSPLLRDATPELRNSSSQAEDTFQLHNSLLFIYGVIMWVWHGPIMKKVQVKGKGKGKVTHV